jgi:HK97 family phage portal protein
MESAQQREERIARLEESRAARGYAGTGISAIGALPDGPVEIAPGRGDLMRTSVPVGPSGPLMSPWLTSGGPTNAVWTVDGRQVSFARIFSQQQWVAAAIMRMLTWSVRVPLKVYRRTGDDSRERLRDGEHPLASAIAHPWPGGYPAALTMALLGPFLVHGNSVIEMMEGRSGAIAFEPHDWRVTIPQKATPGAMHIDGWKVYDEMGQAVRSFSADQAIHAKWWSPLGPEGISPLQQLGVTLRIEDAAMRYQQAQFRNGARPPSAITATTEFLGLEPEVRDKLLEQLREDVTVLYAGPENGGRPALLPPGLDWKPVGHTSREAELIEQRYIDREEIAAVFQIPPPMLGDLRRATFSNITELRQVAYTDGLGPPLVIIEQVLTSVYQELTRERDVYVEFDFAGVLRGDFLKEINALRAAIATGLMTPNEGRATINRPQSAEANADKLWMPWNNLWPMGTAPPQNRSVRRSGAGTGAEAAAERPVLHICTNWRTAVDAERAAQAIIVPDDLLDDPTTAEEAIA